LSLTFRSQKEKKTEKKTATAAKVGRRLSSRVGDLFKPRKAETPTPAKVDENPPKIDEPAPVAPLENPASTAVEATESAPAPADEPKAEAPPATAVVAAAA
jgi:hypothetical protein